MTTEKTTDIDPRACALTAAQAADELKATDLLVQHVGTLMTSTEYFVIATAANNRQVDAIIDRVEENVRKKHGLKPLHREGIEGGTWALLDYGSFIVHVFQPAARDYYRLETLWNDAPIVDLAEAGITDVKYSDRIAKLMERAGVTEKNGANA